MKSENVEIWIQTTILNYTIPILKNLRYELNNSGVELQIFNSLRKAFVSTNAAPLNETCGASVYSNSVKLRTQVIY